MSAYRDELDAAQHRIVELEDELEQQASERERLQRAVQSANDALDDLRRRFDGAPAASRKRQIGLLLVAITILVAIGGAVVILNSRVEAGIRGGREIDRRNGQELQEAERQAAEPRRELEAEKGQILADPLDPPAKTPEMVPTDGRFDERAQKQALGAKAIVGSASEGELRMLKAICMHDGDRDCRNFAVRRLAELSED